MIFIIAIAAFESTLLGGIFAIRFKDKLHLILGFSAGAVLGVAFFDLLPESFELASKNYDLKLITLFIAIGFAVFMLIDRFFSIHAHSEEGCQKSRHQGNLAAAALCLHSFLDGLGIGLAFKISPALGFVVAAAVLTHDFSDGINTVSMILKNKGEKNKAFKWLVADAVAPVLGIVVTLFFTVPAPMLGLILAIFTGLFIYIGASDLIPESHHRHPTIWTTLMTIFGILVLYLVIHFAG